MKAFVAVLIFCLADGLLAGSSTETELHGYMRQCLSESGLDPGLVEPLKTKSPDELKIPKTKMNCFIACVYKQLGALSEDGTILNSSSEEQILEWSENKKNECKQKAGKDICALAGCLEETSKLFS